jgi:hypothetical protein
MSIEEQMNVDERRKYLPNGWRYPSKIPRCGAGGRDKITPL